MLPEIESVRGEQLSGTPEARRLAWPGVQFPGNRIQLSLGEAGRKQILLGYLSPAAFTQ